MANALCTKHPSKYTFLMFEIKSEPVSSLVYLKPQCTEHPQNCDRQELTVTTSEGSYPKDSLPFTRDFCLIVKKIKKICANPDRKLAFEERYKAGKDGVFSCNDFAGWECASMCILSKLSKPYSLR